MMGAVGLAYDEMARRQWSEYAYNGVEDFSVNTACLTIDTALRSRAEHNYGSRRKGGKGDYE